MSGNSAADNGLSVAAFDDSNNTFVGVFICMDEADPCLEKLLEDKISWYI